MNRKLSDWASIAEILASGAVVVTLVLLLIGVRENTAITRASMYSSTLDQFNAFETAMVSDPDLHEVYVRYIDLETAELNDSDRERVITIIGLMFRTFDRAFNANQYRLLGDDEWDRFKRSICRHYDRARSAGGLDVAETLTSSQFWAYVVNTCQKN